MSFSKTIDITRPILHKFGLDVIRYKPEYSPSYSLAKLLKHKNINTFVDIGANTGQTGTSLIIQGYAGKIISLEPLADAYKVLQDKSKKNKRWYIKKCAVGDKDGNIIINVSENLQSSSILPILTKHTQADPKSKYIKRERTGIYKLDTLIPKFVQKDDKLFIKIDAQGYESKILKGAKRSLKRAVGLQIECSLTPLYKGEPGYREILEKLNKLGFKLFQIYPGFTDSTTGRLLQFDGIFFK